MFLQAQSAQKQTGLFFYHLNTSHGLSDNYIHTMAIDSSGNLWVGTGEGLNMFNGKTVVKYFVREYPELGNDFHQLMLCDAQNRIWVSSSGNYVSVIDEDRRFHAVSLVEQDTVVPIRRILYPKSEGVILLTRKGHYRLSPQLNLAEVDTLTSEHFIRFNVAGFDSLYQRGFQQIEPIDDKRYLYMQTEKAHLINYATQRVERRYDFPKVTKKQKVDFLKLRVLARWDENTMLAFDNEFQQLQLVDLTTGAITYRFDNLRDQYGKPITAEIMNGERINADQIVLTAFKAGMYVLNIKTAELLHYTHSATDPASIANNTPFVIAADKNGWVFLGTTPHGVSYYKRDAVIGQQAIFQDATGHTFDGYINTIVSQDNDTYYIGTTDHLIKWQRSVNATEFLNYDYQQEDAPIGPGIYSLAFDPQQRLWISTLNDGIYVLDVRTRAIVKQFINLPGEPDLLPSDIAFSLQMSPDGWMWLSTSKGLCRIHTTTLKIDRLENTPLNELYGSNCNRTWFSDQDNLWIATGSRGAWHYHFPSQTLINFNTKNGLLSNEVFSICADNHNNIYIGTNGGLQIQLHDGRTKQITTAQGLLNNRAEVVVRDQRDRIWIGNDVGLACFNMADTSLRVFDERYGLSVYGFRVGSYHQNSNDELIWGTERGIQYFYPDNLYDQKVTLPTTINRIETRDVVRNLTKDATINLAPADNYVTFYFTSIDYSKHLRTFYQYKLEGADEEWIQVVDQNSVRYSSLPAGQYTFRVRVSNDEAIWEDAENTVTIIIGERFWNQTWFRLASILLLSVIAWRIARYYRRKRHIEQEELETQVVINYFASRINSYRKTEDLLWDVAENCISKLHFDDCVIYLLDDSRNVLVQKAAYGPKADKAMTAGRIDLTIHKPIDIPVGHGIVGAVALSGKAELIPDTSLDKRYIVDDIRRYSEITVPMMVDNNVIGIIDSEHSRKHFFTQKHMNILSTIATLCANQIRRVRAEEEKQQAMIEVLKNKQKVTESRLQSLRLQMNPHFLFNALNSIQQMILANEEMVATRYLSRFSKLLRTILIHSDKEMVTLKEELDILRLYVDLESVRFKDAFRYSIDCDEEIDIDEVKIPTLLIQPFVENAIWHGLMHKEGDRHLSVSFFEQDDKLHCIIEDNGIGREKAQELKLTSGHGKDHTSKGIAVSVERLKTMTGGNGHGGSMDIIDLKDASGKAVGTRVEIRMPMQN